MNADLKNAVPPTPGENGVRKYARGLLAIVAVVAFVWLSLEVLADKSLPRDTVLIVTGGAIVQVGNWVASAFSFYFGSQDQSTSDGTNV